MKHWRAILFGALVAIPFGSVSCDDASSPTSSDAGGAPANGCPPVASDDAGPSGPTSFRNGVLPIFARSCSFESCHGTSRADRVQLGTVPDAGTTDASTPMAIRAALLERSKQSDLALVLPSHPEESFLMLKLDDDLCRIASRCPDGCGEAMPRSSDLLDPARRATIRQWIAAGALDD